MSNFDWTQAAANARDVFRAGTLGGKSNWGSGFDSQIDLATKLALQQYETKANYELWRLNNQYNSPTEQMKRFKEAGLNPMLVYQQGTPGNSNSPANLGQMQSFNYQPTKDLATKINAASEVIGMVSNLAQNVASIWGSGYDLQLKKNEVIESDFNKSLMNYALPYEVGNAPRMSYHNLQETLNPLSPKFDPLAYMAFNKMGNMPMFFSQYKSAEAQRALLGYKEAYQKYYNENLLPKFNEYQQGKIDLQEIERVLQDYERQSIEMIPPEVRGILQPVLQWISPFIKFIFKSSTFKRQ